MITEQEKQVIQQVIDIFETSSPEGDYGLVTLLPNDPGGLTYGRSQTTLNSGNLELMLDMYLAKRLHENPDPNNMFHILAVVLKSAMHHVRIKSRLLNEPDVFMSGILKTLADDPLMRQCQDEFFDEAYWEPAYEKAVSMGLRHPLSYAVVYDGYIHGFFGGIRKKFPERPPADGGLEQEWTSAYVRERHAWLKSKRHLRKTTYRMNFFMGQILLGNWELEPPFMVNGIRVP